MYNTSKKGKFENNPFVHAAALLAKYPKLLEDVELIDVEYAAL